MTIPLARLGWASLAITMLAVALWLSAAQTTARQSVAEARTAAEAAYLAGRYDEVDRLAAAHAGDETVAVWHGKALIARGRYGDAEQVLDTAASRAPAGDAALELGLLQLSLGRRSEGRRTLQLLLMSELTSATAQDYARAARASRALGRFQEANDFFREAVALAPEDAAIETAWGELFLEKHDPANAARSFQNALKVRPDYGPAQLGMARATAEDNPPAAERFARRALELNPSDVGAHLLLARMAILEDRRESAWESIRQAQAVNPHSLDAHALAGALHYVEGNRDGYEQAVAAALAINPLYGEAFRVAGEIAAQHYRFDEAAELARRAIVVDRENPRAHADLGMHLMRTGDEQNARRALETAFRIDPYDVVTYNLLELLDQLDTFETVTHGDLIVRLHPEEAPVMREFVPALAQEALDTLSERWNFAPTGPILVEMFPRHDDFAVRNVGLPGMIGALGACFGRVVTLDSPRARPPGDFNWGATLWHEMAHVIALQLSNQRVPRWLTEGISVFEEKRARPEWGREMEVAFARAMDERQVLPLRDLNSGFQDPRTISLAYYQASLLVEHLVERFGEPALRALVAAFADTIDTEDALRRALQTDFDGLQGSFDAFLEARFADVRRALRAPEGFRPDQPIEALRAAAAEHPGSYPVQVALGAALRESDPDAAIAAFERAIALVPMITGPESPYMQIVEISLARGDKARAAQALEAMTRHDHTAIEAARQWVSLLDPDTDRDQLRIALERVVAIDPFDGPAHSTLGRLALDAGEAERATRHFRVALAASPVNRAAAHADLAEALLLAGDRDEARRQTLAALEIAPTYERAQQLLLRIAGGPR